MYKLVIIACVFAAANAGLIAAPYAGLPLGYAGAYAGAPLGYAGAYAGAPLGYAGAYAGLPLAYAGAPLAAAPIAIAPQAYALPAVRDIAEAPIVEQAVEKVEQHGYSIRY